MPDPLRPASDDAFLGFDYGTRHIGVAVGQRLTGIASPLGTVRVTQNKPDWSAIEKLVAEWRPAGLVIGIAYQPDGSENPITQAMLRFARQLEGRFRLPVHAMDETLSTFESRLMLYGDLQVRRKTYLAAKDALAAQRILQSWLNMTAPRESPA
jgi:putative Holliday junction resolvase